MRVASHLTAGRIARSNLWDLGLAVTRLRILFHFVCSAAWRVFVKFMV